MIKKLKAMIKEPVSKEWFEKHAKSKALESKGEKYLKQMAGRSSTKGYAKHHEAHEKKHGTLADRFKKISKERGY